MWQHCFRKIALLAISRVRAWSIPVEPPSWDRLRTKYNSKENLKVITFCIYAPVQWNYDHNVHTSNTFKRQERCASIIYQTKLLLHYDADITVNHIPSFSIRRSSQVNTCISHIILHTCGVLFLRQSTSTTVIISTNSWFLHTCNSLY